MLKRHTLHLHTERLSRVSSRTKRLGDGFYEQRLIREQVAQLTGQRFLTGYSSDEDEYQALMANGITFAQQYQLIPGVALSDAQIAQLTSDIVWLVERTITLADGTTIQALVPQVYVRLQPGDINDQGALLAGDSINLHLTGNPSTEGTLTNSGSIAGRTVVSITADNIDVIGGRIQAGDQLLLDARRDINLSGTTNTTSMQQHTGSVTANATLTQVNRLAGLYVTNPNGLLFASAANNINLNAAEIINSGVNGSTIIDAGNNLNLGTLTATSDTYGQGVSNNGHSWSSTHTSTEVGSSIQTQGDMTLNAGNDLTARAANVTSEQGALHATAGNNLTIVSGTATHDMEAYRENENSGFLSSSQGMHHDTVNSTDVIGSTFSGNTVNLNAGNDLSIQGSNVVGTNDVNLNAGNNISITSAQATHDETHYAEEEHTGFSSSGASVSYGSSTLQTSDDTQQVINVGSTVGSVQGNVNINAGKAYTQTASDVLTPQGDINITAQSVDINAATDTTANQQSMEYEQSGITLAVSNPVLSAAQTVSNMHQAASNTSDPRMQALAAATTALAVNNAANAVIAGNTPQFDEHGLQILDANGQDPTENPANQVGGINVSISIGHSESSSSSSQTANSVSGSTLNAGGNINITATGDGTNNPNTGNINVIGSNVTANHDVKLTAQNAINLQAAQNTQAQQSENDSSNASLGIGFSLGGQSNGFTINAGLSGSEGNANGNGTTWTETTIQGGRHSGDSVTLNSGTDTNLIGAQVSGNQVIANVGTSGHGNLNIESLQDINRYNSEQSNYGVSVSLCIPPFCTGASGGSFSMGSSNTDSNYQSVNEQAGIFAGDGGFQVNVNGNTNLTGAVLASGEQAIQNNANSLTTQTLTTSNIANSAEYEAEASSATVGAGTQGGLPQLSGAGIGEDSGDASSTTLSGISGGTVSVTDNTQQTTLTGNDATTTVALLNRDVHVNENGEAVDSQGNSTANTIAPIFDAEKVQKEINAQMEITQAFSQQAPVALNSFAQSQMQSYLEANKTLDDAKAQLELTTDPVEQEQLQTAIIEAEQTIIETQADYEKWKEGGDYRVASNIIIAAISGGTSGAVGAVTKESLSWAADVMRQAMIEDSMRFPGICDSNSYCLDNMSGESVGVNGDQFKLAGGRVDLDKLCEQDRCKTNEDGSRAFKGNLAEFLQSEEGQDMRSPMGGFQGEEGLFAFFDYVPGSIWDKLAEAYAGTHDTLNSGTWYDDQGNIKKAVEDTLAGKVGNVTNYTNVVLATPFALSVLLPPEVWNAVLTSMKGVVP